MLKFFSSFRFKSEQDARIVAENGPLPESSSLSSDETRSVMAIASTVCNSVAPLHAQVPVQAQTPGDWCLQTAIQTAPPHSTTHHIITQGPPRKAIRLYTLGTSCKNLNQALNRTPSSSASPQQGAYAPNSIQLGPKFWTQVSTANATAAAAVAEVDPHNNDDDDSTRLNTVANSTAAGGATAGGGTAGGGTGNSTMTDAKSFVVNKLEEPRRAPPPAREPPPAGGPPTEKQDVNKIENKTEFPGSAEEETHFVILPEEVSTPTGKTGETLVSNEEHEKPPEALSTAPPRAASTAPPRAASTAPPRAPSTASPKAPPTTFPRLSQTSSPRLPPTALPKPRPTASPRTPPATSPRLPPITSTKAPPEKSPSPKAPPKTSPRSSLITSPKAPPATSPRLSSTTSTGLSPTASLSLTPPLTRSTSPRASAEARSPEIRRQSQNCSPFGTLTSSPRRISGVEHKVPAAQSDPQLSLTPAIIQTEVPSTGEQLTTIMPSDITAPLDTVSSTSEISRRLKLDDEIFFCYAYFLSFAKNHPGKVVPEKTGEVTLADMFSYVQTKLAANSSLDEDHPDKLSEDEKVIFERIEVLRPCWEGQDTNVPKMDSSCESKIRELWAVEGLLAVDGKSTLSVSKGARKVPLAGIEYATTVENMLQLYPDFGKMLDRDAHMYLFVLGLLLGQKSIAKMSYFQSSVFDQSHKHFFGKKAYWPLILDIWYRYKLSSQAAEYTNDLSDILSSESRNTRTKPGHLYLDKSMKEVWYKGIDPRNIEPLGSDFSKHLTDFIEGEKEVSDEVKVFLNDIFKAYLGAGTHLIRVHTKTNILSFPANLNNSLLRLTPKEKPSIPIAQMFGWQPPPQGGGLAFTPKCQAGFANDTKINDWHWNYFFDVTELFKPEIQSRDDLNRSDTQTGALTPETLAKMPETLTSRDFVNAFEKIAQFIDFVFGKAGGEFEAVRKKVIDWCCDCLNVGDDAAAAAAAASLPPTEATEPAILRSCVEVMITDADARKFMTDLDCRDGARLGKASLNKMLSRNPSVQPSDETNATIIKFVDGCDFQKKEKLFSTCLIDFLGRELNIEKVHPTKHLPDELNNNIKDLTEKFDELQNSRHNFKRNLHKLVFLNDKNNKGDQTAAFRKTLTFARNLLDLYMRDWEKLDKAIGQQTFSSSPASEICKFEYETHNIYTALSTNLKDGEIKKELEKYDEIKKDFENLKKIETDLHKGRVKLYGAIESVIAGQKLS